MKRFLKKAFETGQEEESPEYKKLLDALNKRYTEFEYKTDPDRKHSSSDEQLSSEDKEEIYRETVMFLNYLLNSWHEGNFGHMLKSSSISESEHKSLLALLNKYQKNAEKIQKRYANY